MEIQFTAKSFPYCRELFRQSKVVTENAECVVSDVYDDIGKIVSAGAQLNLKSKDVTPHGVSIGAEAEVHVLYMTEDRRRLQCMRWSKEFSVDFEVADVTPDTQPQIRLCCQSVQARAVNSRKIAAQLSIRAELVCRVEDALTLPYTAQIEPCFGLQMQQEGADCILCVQSAEKSFVVSEQIPLTSAEKSPSALLYACCTLKHYDCQMIGQKALLKGGVELEAAWLCENGEPGFLSQCIPWSVLIDAPGEDCSASAILLQQTALYCELSDAINASRVLELELHAVAQLCFKKTVHLDYFSDAYSTRYPLRLSEDTLRLSESKTVYNLSASASESVPGDSVPGEILSERAELSSCTVRDGKALASVAVCVLLREEDGTLGSLQKLLLFEAELPEAEATLLGAELSNLRVERRGEELVLSGECLFTLGEEQTLTLPCLSGAELDEAQPFELASIPALSLVNRRGRSLWELAKRYHSSIEAIERFSASFPTGEGVVLIPRL